MVQVDRYDDERQVSTGVPGLDDVLQGGLPANRLHLLQGTPGSGKTTTALHFLRQGVADGERVLYVTLAETRDELESVARSHGWTLDGIDLYELAPNVEALRPDAQYTVLRPGEVELTETIWAVLEEVERLQPRRLVLDSLAELRLLANDSLRYRRQVLALKQFFSGRGCTVLVLDNVGDAESSIESIAHSVIQLEQLLPLQGGARRRLRAVKVRGVNYRTGYHDFAIETGGLRVFPRLVAAEHRDRAKRTLVPSGVAEIDALLGGGLVDGSSTLLIGPAGSGKSVLIAQYALAAAQRGEPSAIYIFDESAPMFLTRSEGLGIDLDPYIESGLVTLRQLDTAEVTPGQFDSMVRDAAEDGARVIAIDSLNGYLNAMTEEQLVLLKLHELLSYLSAQRVLTLMTVAQHGTVGDNMQTPLDVSYLADSVILLRYFEASGELRQAISVVKKRTGAHERTIRQFSLSAGAIHVGEPLREFRGVLSGVPEYVGQNASLLQREAQAGS